MMIHRNTRKIVVVEWIDSRKPDPDWVFADNFEPEKPCECMSVGFLIETEDQDNIILALSIADQFEENPQLSGTNTIPCRSIKKITTLKDNASDAQKAKSALGGE